MKMSKPGATLQTQLFPLVGPSWIGRFCFQSTRISNQAQNDLLIKPYNLDYREVKQEKRRRQRDRQPERYLWGWAEACERSGHVCLASRVFRWINETFWLIHMTEKTKQPKTKLYPSSVSESDTLQQKRIRPESPAKIRLRWSCQWTNWGFTG